MTEEFSRQHLALEGVRRMTLSDVIKVLERLVDARGAPAFIRSENGPEFMAEAVQKWMVDWGLKTLYIVPGSPWKNPSSEIFNSRFWDGFLNRESFVSVLEAKVPGQGCRQEYNCLSPTRRWVTSSHRSLRSPALRQSPLGSSSRKAALRPPKNRTKTKDPKLNANSHNEWIKS